MSNYTTTQTRIAKVIQEVGYKLYGTYGEQAKSHIVEYLLSHDSVADLSALCTNLKDVINSFSDDINSHISIHSAINQILGVCGSILTELTIGNTVFYHTDQDYTHAFYMCIDANDAQPKKLYETTSDLTSFIAAENACANWVSSNVGKDLYGSYNTDCSGAEILTDPYSACLAGRDHKSD